MSGFNPNPKWFSHGCGMEYPWPRFCRWVALGQADGIFLPHPLPFFVSIWRNCRIAYFRWDAKRYRAKAKQEQK